MAPAVPVTGSAIDDDELPRMDVSIKQGDSKKIKLNWNSYEGADYYCVFYVKGSFEQPSEDEGKINYINQNFVYNETEFTLEVSRGQNYSFCLLHIQVKMLLLPGRTNLRVVFLKRTVSDLQDLTQEK